MAENNEQQEVSPIQQVGSNTLCGSVSQYVRPDLMKDDQFQDMSNMRQDKFGVLREISLAETIEKYGSNIDLQGTDKVFIWQPNNKYKLSWDERQELIIAWCGESSSAYYGVTILYYQYTIGSNGSITRQWSRMTSGTEFVRIESIGEPRFVQVNYGVVMVNGRKNNTAYRMEIDKDGELVHGQVGVTPPLNKLTIDSNSITFLDGDFSQTGVRKGCSLQYCYTYKTYNGDESNPSPIASWASTVPPEQDDDGNFKGWIEKAVLSGMVLHEKLQPQEKAQIASYVIYRRAFFGSATTTNAGSLTDSNAVWGKVGEMSVSDIYFTDTSIATTSLSYENDKAQKGDMVVANNNRIFIGNSTSYLSFPFNFKYYMPIRIKNPNSFYYYGIKIIFNIPDKTQGTSVCSFLNWEEALQDKNALRIFAPDMNTPVSVKYDASGGIHNLKIEMEMEYGVPPFLEQTFYLAWGGTGIDVDSWKTAAYGEWVQGSIVE